MSALTSLTDRSPVRKGFLPLPDDRKRLELDKHRVNNGFCILKSRERVMKRASFGELGVFLRKNPTHQLTPNAERAISRRFSFLRKDLRQSCQHCPLLFSDTCPSEDSQETLEVS